MGSNTNKCNKYERQSCSIFCCVYLASYLITSIVFLMYTCRIFESASYLVDFSFVFFGFYIFLLLNFSVLGRIYIFGLLKSEGFFFFLNEV